MPSQQQHKNKAEHDFEAHEILLQAGRFDWAAVCLFYSTLHLVESLRAFEGKLSQYDQQNHRERLFYIQNYHPKIEIAYRAIQQAGFVARYEPRSLFFKQYQEEDVVETLQKNYYQQILDYVNAGVAKT